MEETKGTLKEKAGNVFETIADRSQNMCVYLVWGDEAEMPRCLQQSCEAMDE